MNPQKRKSARRNRIKSGLAKRIKGLPDKPRLNVYKSNKQIYAQIIDDKKGHTVAASSSLMPAVKDQVQATTKIEQAKIVGQELAKKAEEAKVHSVVFDRNGYLYHGRIKALADGARQGGLNF